MGVLEVVKKGFSVAKQCTSLILVLFAFGFVWNLINISVAPQDPTAPGAAASPALIGLGLLFILASIFMQAGSLGFVLQTLKSGQSNFATFVEAGKKNFVKLLLIALIVTLFIGILVILAVLAIMIGGGNNGQPNPIAMLIGISLAVVAVIAGLLVFLAPYSVVADGTSSIEAIQKSIGLVKKHVLQIIMIGLVLILIGFAVGFLIGFIVGILSGILTGTAGQIVASFVSSFINAWLGVATTAAFMTFYLSLGSTPASEPAPSA